MKDKTFKKFGLTKEQAVVIKPWAFNQGFYNLFLALGLFYSLLLLNTSEQEMGELLASFILVTIFGAGLVLYVSVPQKYLAALIQAVPALLGFLLLYFS